MITNHIDNTLGLVRTIFEKASFKIEAIPVGDKICATKLADQIGKEVGIPGPNLYPVIKLLFNNYPGVVVKRGKNGGIIRTSK